MSDFRGRGRGRGGPPRGGGYRGRGSMMDRDGGRGGFRGRGYSRGGRGGPSRSRDDMSPPRKTPLLSRSYDTSGGRRHDRYEDSYDRGPPSHRSRDLYSSPPRDSGRGFDRMSPPPRGRDRDYPSSSRHTDYTSSRGDYFSHRNLSPPRDSGYGSSYKDSYSNGMRDDRHDSFSRSNRDYPPRGAGGDYDRGSRDFHDSSRDYGSSRDYPSSRGGGYRDPMGPRDFRGSGRNDRLSNRDFDDDDGMPSWGGDEMDFRDRRDRSYGSRGRGSSRFNDRGPPLRDFAGRGRGRGRDDRGRGFMGGSRGRGGPPRGRGRSEFSGRSDRRSPLSSRDGPGGKRPRMESSDYRR